MLITRKHLSRRTFLHGTGGALAMPMLDSMMPAKTQTAKNRAGKKKIRLACLEMVHGSAGATKFGAEKNMWSPVAAGRDFDLSPTSMKPLEPYREYLTIVSSTDCRMAEAFSDHEVGRGDDR